MRLIPLLPLSLLSLLSLSLDLFVMDRVEAVPLHHHNIDPSSLSGSTTKVIDYKSSNSRTDEIIAVTRRQNDDGTDVKNLMDQFRVHIDLIIKRFAKNQLVSSVTSDKLVATLVDLREHKVNVNQLIDDKGAPLTGDTKQHYTDYFIYIRRRLKTEKKAKQ